MLTRISFAILAGLTAILAVLLLGAALIASATWLIYLGAPAPVAALTLPIVGLFVIFARIGWEVSGER